MTGPQVSSEPLIESAIHAYERGDTAGALAMVDDVLRRQPGDVRAQYVAASLELELGRVAAATLRLESAARLQPHNGEIAELLGNAYAAAGRHPEAVAAYQAARQAGQYSVRLLNNLGMSLKEVGAVDLAIATYQEALRLAPDDADVYNNMAIALNRRHDYEGAIAAYRRALELAPDNPDLWGNLATIYEQSNRLEEAQAVVVRGLALAPQDERLLLTAARCARRNGSVPETVTILEAQLPRTDLTPVIRRTMEFELGRAYDMLGQTDQAFRHFTAGNDLTGSVWPALRAGADAFLADLDRRLAIGTPAWLAALPRTPPEERPSPVFLVSFPRSGTTLMDTMLEAHGDIQVLEEEPMVEALSLRLRDRPGGYPEALAALGDEELRAWRRDYWTDVDRLAGGTSRAAVVLDKNPLYSAHAAFIRQLFPGARFIFALRHPCDVVLSCFMQAFGNNPALENFRDLETAALTYRKVMDLWRTQREALDLQVHVLRYESLVQDPQAELRCLLGFLGLDWHEGMQDHTRQAKKRGRIYTPSYHQVVQPVYGDAVERWRRYRRHFGRALEILEPYVRESGYSLD